MADETASRFELHNTRFKQAVSLGMHGTTSDFDLWFDHGFWLWCRNHEGAQDPAFWLACNEVADSVGAKQPFPYATINIILMSITPKVSKHAVRDHSPGTNVELPLVPDP
jgi:hypothetical protein